MRQIKMERWNLGADLCTETGDGSVFLLQSVTKRRLLLVSCVTVPPKCGMCPVMRRYKRHRIKSIVGADPPHFLDLFVQFGVVWVLTLFWAPGVNTEQDKQVVRPVFLAYAFQTAALEEIITSWWVSPR